MKKALLTLSLLIGFGLPAQAQLTDELPEIEIPDFIQNLEEKIDETVEEENDYSHLPPQAEKYARLNDLFRKLRAEEDPSSANLVAEEIWAIWLNSGSASVDLLLRRGTAAGKAGDNALARRMYDHVTTIRPDYAEGWARSGRLAFEEDDYNRAVVELTKALILEPRHFYALWSMGNILESLGRMDEALEAYTKAHDQYPALPQIKNRKEALESALQGAVL